MPHFMSSGDLTADRRYELAPRTLEQRGDLAGAADLLCAGPGACAGLCPGLVRARRITRTGWATGPARSRRSARRCAADPDDRHGAGLRLARLDARCAPAMTAGYVRALFDEYAPRFDARCGGSAYRGAEICWSALAKRAARRDGACASAPCSISAAAPGSRARRSGRLWIGWRASTSRPP